MTFRPLLTVFFLGLPALAQAQNTPPPPVALDCQLATICLEAAPCTEWGQDITVRETDGGGWNIVWQEDLPSDYALVADLPAPEGSLAPTHLRSFLLPNAETQAVQLISVEDGGNIVVTLHQPHLRPRSVTGFGTCTPAEGSGE